MNKYYGTTLFLWCIKQNYYQGKSKAKQKRKKRNEESSNDYKRIDIKLNGTSDRIKFV